MFSSLMESFWHTWSPKQTLQSLGLPLTHWIHPVKAPEVWLVSPGLRAPFTFTMQECFFYPWQFHFCSFLAKQRKCLCWQTCQHKRRPRHEQKEERRTATELNVFLASDVTERTPCRKWKCFSSCVNPFHLEFIRWTQGQEKHYSSFFIEGHCLGRRMRSLLVTLVFQLRHCCCAPLTTGLRTWETMPASNQQLRNK